MLKMVQGVINFHKNVLPGLRHQFAQLGNGQSPDTLMIACSDSRVVPNLFASTDPGDLFVIRNPGNLVPAYQNTTTAQTSEGAAIEIAVDTLKVKDIIVCGHSHCAGMTALLNEEKATPQLKQWLRHGQKAKSTFHLGKAFNDSLPAAEQLSQLNVMSQLENLKTYPEVLDHLKAGTLRLHGWWFDIAAGNVYAFDPEEKKFLIIDENQGAKILQRLTT